MMKYESHHCGEHIQSRPFLRKSSKISDPFLWAGLVWVVAVFMSCLIFAVSVLSQTVKPTPDDEPIRVDTNYVSVPVSVIDKQGRFISDLQKAAFQLFEDDREQEIVSFGTVDQPFTVIVLLDRSGSMSFHLGEMAEAASIFVKQLRPDDTIAAFSFASSVREVFPFLRASEFIKPAVIKKHADDRSTYIYDAVDLALRKVKQIKGRKAILLFSDGAGGDNFSSAKDNFRDAEEGEALIYTIQFDTFSPLPPRHISKELWKERVESARSYMEKLADKSGGRFYQIQSINSLAATFRSIAKEIGQQYTLGYYPGTVGKDGERRKIKVKVNVPNAVVRSRNEVVYKKSR